MPGTGSGATSAVRVGARSVGGAHAGKAARSRFRHGAIIIASHGPLLLQIGADRFKIVVE